MKKKFKGFYLIVSSFVIAFCICLLHLQNQQQDTKIFFHPPADSTNKYHYLPQPPLFLRIKSVYDSLHLSLKGLSQQAFDFAKQGLQKLIEEGKLLNDSIISIIDFSQPSNQKRLLCTGFEKL